MNPTHPLRPILLALLVALPFLGQPLAAQSEEPNTPQEPDKPQKVTKLDGTSFFGLVEVTDDYTIRIRTDSGIANLPIAGLSQKDFQKYSGDSDRSKDGRLWSERQDALQNEQKKEKKGESPNHGIEIQLAEIAPLQPVISAYEQVLGEKSSEKKSDENSAQSAASPSPDGNNQPTRPTRNMFSGPGSLNVPDVPFAGTAGEMLTTPATTATESLGGVVPTGLTPP